MEKNKQSADKEGQKPKPKEDDETEIEKCRALRKITSFPYLTFVRPKPKGN